MRVGWRCEWQKGTFIRIINVSSRSNHFWKSQQHAILNSPKIFFLYAAVMRFKIRWKFFSFRLHNFIIERQLKLKENSLKFMMMMKMKLMANGKGRHYFQMPHLVLLSRDNFRFPFSLSCAHHQPTHKCYLTPQFIKLSK